MKKVKRIGAIALGTVTLCTAFSFSGCAGFGRVKTEDEIYLALMNATQEFLEYEDEMTITMTMKEESKNNEGYSKSGDVTMKFSLHPEEDKMFFTMKSEDADMQMKIFKENDQPYMYTKMRAKKSTTSNGVVTDTHTVEQETYNATTQDCVDQFTGLFTFANYAGIDFEDLIHDYQYSFTETKLAYESVYAEQLAQEKKSNENADAKYEMSVDKSLNKISYQALSQVTTKGFTRSGDYGNFTVTTQEKIVGKRGKISAVTASEEVSFSSTQDHYQNTKKVTVDMKIDYSFDKKGYKAIETQLPESVETRNFIQRQMQMKFNINGYLFTKSASSGSSFSSAYVFQACSNSLRGGGYTIEWFEDEAYTKPFVPDNLSYKEFCKIDCVYGKLTPLEGNAVLFYDYTVCDERTDAYKVVFGPVVSSRNEKDAFERITVGANSTFTLPIYGDAYKTFINGERYDATNALMTAEQGKVYHLEIGEVITNEDFSIFDIALATAKG